MKRLAAAAKLTKGFVIGASVGFTAALALSDHQRRRLTEILNRVTNRDDTPMAGGN